MLLENERTEVRDTLAQSIALASGGTVHLKTIFQARAGEVLLRVAVDGARPEQLAEAVVTYCLEMRWTQTPSCLEMLLGYLVNTQGTAALAPILARVRQGKDPLPDPFQARWVVADLPFYDRTSLRNHARELAEQGARPLMRVSGDSGWGRTYTVRLFDYVSETRADTLHVVHETLQPQLGPSYEVVELAEALTSPMGVQEPLPGRTASNYPAALVRYVLRNATRQMGRWIFVLEGFGQADVQKEVREMVQLLAQQISSSNYRKRMRLVLIDYNDALPRVLPADILEEKLPPPRDLSQDDVLQCLTALDANRRKKGLQPMDVAQLPQVAQVILAGAPNDGKARLEYVYEQLLKIRDGV